MTSLTRAKKISKTFAFIGGGLLVLYIFVQVSINIASQISLQRVERAIATANVNYGVIDAPTLASSSVSANTASLSLDLVNGTFPQASPTARVYRVAAPSLSLSAQDRARTKATGLGFTSEPEQPDPSTFIWKESGRTLQISLTDQTFTLTTDLVNLSLAGRQSFARLSPIGRQTAQFIQGQLPFTDIDYSSPAHRFVNPTGQLFLPQPEEATLPTNYAQVTFFRQKLNELPFYTAKGKFGPITAVTIPAVTPTGNQPLNQAIINVNQLVYLQNSYLPIDIQDYATYPVISGSTAYELLRSSFTKALISVEPVNGAITPTTMTSARVLFATLAYLEPDQDNKQYVQPVWLFEGRGSTNQGEAQWKAIVPAIDAQATQKLLSAKKQ